MTIAPRSAHRKRRSHFFSSTATVSRSSQDPTRRLLTKRPHSNALIVAADRPWPTRKCAPEARNGTKRRRNFSVSSEVAGDAPFSTHEESSSIFSKPMSKPSFAATAAEFDLFPRRYSSSRLKLRSTSSDIATPTDNIPYEDFIRLRSDAFGALRRSVVENGEGLVRRMRDYERCRISNDIPSKGRHMLPFSGPAQYLAPSACALDEDEDDVHFIQHEEPEIPSYDSPELTGMDSCIDSCSPDTHLQGPPRKVTPARYPSQSSLEASPSSLLSTLPSTSNVTSLSLQSSPMTVARSEKALTALTLAMANGAGSIDDYDTLRALQKSSLTASDANSAGELWN